MNMSGKKMAWIGKFALGGILIWLAGCASVPGKTGTEQVETMDDLVKRTLADLYKQHPEAKEKMAKAVGYSIMTNTITKIPIFGAGGGYGVAISLPGEERTYLQMWRFDIGAGWGARSIRPVLIFHDEKKFKTLIDGEWEFNLGAEASAKVGEKGAAGGGGGAKLVDPGFTPYTITDAGVSATATVGIIRTNPIRLKEVEPSPEAGKAPKEEK
jgi:hypothetical protein